MTDVTCIATFIDGVHASVDRSPKGQDTVGGLIEDESAVGAAETP